MIFLGALALLLGWLLGIEWLWAVGVVALVIGGVFWLLGRIGRPVGGRSHWY